jgi:hypothetical protein
MPACFIIQRSMQKHRQEINLYSVGSPNLSSGAGPHTRLPQAQINLININPVCASGQIVLSLRKHLFDEG